MFAVTLPILAVVGAGAIEIGFVLTDRQATQDIADQAALSGAREMAVAPVGADQRATNFAKMELAGIATHAAVSVRAALIDKATIRVAIDTQRDSFFGNLLPKGGFRTHVESTAQSLGLAPLCVLMAGPSAGDDLHVDAGAQLQSGCLVHGNQALKVDGGATLTAGQAEASVSASGNIVPTAMVGAPAIPDPFAGLNTSFPTPCNGAGGKIDIAANQPLAAGVHCNDYTIDNGVVLTLGAGEHYFGGSMSLKNSAQMVGDDVVLIFGAGKTLDFKNASNISLNGRKSGPLAGFVIIVDRAVTGTFLLQSDPFSNITGAIYAPNAVLQVDGTKKANQASPWTVVAARALHLTGQANLVINSNYGGSTVPVPAGVGPRAGGRLTLVK